MRPGVKKYLLVLVITGLCSGTIHAAGLPEITGLRYDVATQQVVVDVREGAFDPILSLTPLSRDANGNPEGYRIVMEAEGVSLGKDFGRQREQRLKQLAAMLGGVRDIQLYEYEQDGLSMVKLSIVVDRKLQPQVRDNTGDHVAIALLGQPYQAASTSTKQIAGNSNFELDQPPRYETRRMPTTTTSDKSSLTKTKVAPPAYSVMSRDAARTTRLMPAIPTAAPEATAALALGNTSSDSLKHASSPKVPAENNSDASSSTYSIYAVMENPSESRIHPVVQSAWQSFRQGHLDGASASLEAYLGSVEKQAANQDVNARYLLALVQLAQNQRDKAMQTLTALTHDAPEFLPGWLEALSVTLAEGKFTEAESLLAQASIRFAGNPEIIYAQGLLEEARGNLASARQRYLSVLAIDPYNPFYHYRLSVVDLKDNQPKAAAQELQRILLRNPDDVGALKALGYIYQKEQRPAEALKYYQRALKPDVMINYATLLVKSGQRDDALVLYEAAEKVAPDDANIQYNLGMIYAELGEKTAAKRTLQRFVQLAASGDATRTGADSRLSMAREKLATLSSGR